MPETKNKNQMKDSLLQGSMIEFLQDLNLEIQTLNFRFPIETLDGLLKRFYKENNHSAFLVQAHKSINNLTLRKISNSYLLKVPVKKNNNEHLYIGLSDLLCFLIVFDEPAPEEQSIKEQKSRFFLTFAPGVVKTVFNFFYRHYCNSLSLKEKKLLISLKNVPTADIDPYFISKFQEALLINALSDNNKIKHEKIVEALSFTDEGVVITDIAGCVKEVNQNFKNYFGEDYKSIKDLLPENLIDTALREVAKKHVWQAEIDLKTIQGKSELMLVGCDFFKDELQRPNGFVFTFKNVTELKKLDQLNKQLIAKLRDRNLQLSEVNKRLLEADRIKTDLLSVVSHELKTPISAVIGFSELIANRICDEEAIKNYALQINESARKLDRIITDYLDVASNQFGVSSNKLHTMPINLSELIRHCYNQQALRFPDMKFQFLMDCLGYEPIIISESQNLQKLFNNLLNNSLKYSPSGGKISVKILNDGEHITVSISDQGIGVTFEQAKSVFEPFYRADNSVTREFSGIGLGLAICKKIVEIYNGSIWCEPGIDLGTVFYVSLPVNSNRQSETVKDLEISNNNVDATSSQFYFQNR